jgi:glycosyltransferase involved in cell wall biosynthesis
VIAPPSSIGTAVGSHTEQPATAHRNSSKSPKIFVFDLSCYVPYYNVHFCKALRDRGVDFTLGSISYRLDPDCFRRLGLKNDPGLFDVVSHFSIRTLRLRQALKVVEFCINLLALAVRFTFRRPDILHVEFLPLVEHGIPFEIWFLAYVRMLGIRIVHTVHNVLPQGTGDLRKKPYERVYRKADALICQNEPARARLVNEFGIDPGRTWVIPHGPMFHDQQRPTVEGARERIGLSSGQTAVLWQGIVRPYKGVDFLLEAWSRVHSDFKNSLLIIAGSGPQRELRRIEEKARSLGLESSVRLVLQFLSVEDVANYYQAADVVVYPYQEITTSGALMTGLSYRKALIATSLPPFLELLRDGENALLVEYGDVSGMANALQRLLMDPSERRRLADNLGAEQPAEDPWISIARKTNECYLHVLATSR